MIRSLFFGSSVRQVASPRFKFRISRCLFKLFVYPIYSIMQRVGAIEVIFVVVSQLEAKLVSTDRGQALEVTVGS